MGIFNQTRDIARLEALLFFYGEHMSFKSIGSALGIGESQVSELVELLKKNMDEDDNRGVSLVVDDARVQMHTKSEYGSLYESLVKSELKEELTPATCETLSIVVYAGPLSRAEVDFIRGVNSSFTIRHLVMRGLVEKVSGSRKGILYEYKPTIGCLSHLGVGRVEELPEYDKHRTILERMMLVGVDEDK